MVESLGLRSRSRIARVSATPVTVPLEAQRRHSDGLAPPWNTRTILQLETDDGLIGLGEVGPKVPLEQLRAAVAGLVGADPFALSGLRKRLLGGKFYSQQAASLFAAVEMACLDLQGQAIGRPVADLLGGAVRDRIHVIAYVFRREPGARHGAVSTDQEVVAHTLELVERFGFETIKLKGGVLSPWEEVESIRALRAARPRAALRLDPNGSWSVETSLRVARALADCDLEWLEDPTPGLEGMAEVTRRGGIPTATNMICTHLRELPSTLASRAVDVVLCDLWYWGGMRAGLELAALAEPFGFGLGVHSGGGGCELGVGMAAMLHLAASFPVLVHAVDAVYHHLEDDVIAGGLLPIREGAMAVPTGPGLGVTLDGERFGRYAELYHETAPERARRPPDPTRPGWHPAYPAW